MENPKWYLIEVAPANSTDRPANNVLKFETPAVDKAGAEWLANDALIHFSPI